MSCFNTTTIGPSVPLIRARVFVCITYIFIDNKIDIMPYDGRREKGGSDA